MISKTHLPFRDNPLYNQLTNYPNVGTQGAFFVYDGVTYVRGVYSCRESYSALFSGPSTNRVGFYLNTGIDIELVNEFFVKLKKVLRLSDKMVFSRIDWQIVVPGRMDLLGATTQPSITVDKTKERCVIIADVPPFWTESGFRRALFTLFLRCAAVFYKGDFDKALDAYPLLNTARPMVNAFLSGKIYCAFDITSNLINYFSTHHKHINEKLDEYLSEKVLSVMMWPMPVPPPQVVAPQAVVTLPSNTVRVLSQEDITRALGISPVGAPTPVGFAPINVIHIGSSLRIDL